MFFNDQISRVAEDCKPLLAFFHAQRTGGSRLKQVLRSVYGDDRVYAEQTVSSFKHWLHLRPGDLEAFDVFAGHSNFKDGPNLERAVLPISLVRDPVYRTVSIYDYCKTKEGHVLRQLANSTELEEFYRKGSSLKPAYFKNTQCLRICGIPSAEAAIEWIEQRYAGVGTMDELPRFCERLGNALGWRFEVPEAVGSERERYVGRFGEAFIDAVSRDSAEDAKLYAFVRREVHGP